MRGCGSTKNTCASGCAKRCSAEVLHGLYQTLCQPVMAALPDGIHRLIISPDGELNFVSFATLLDANDRFLADDFELHYVSSGRDFSASATIDVPRTKHTIVFANPDYNDLTPGRLAARRRASASAERRVLLPPLARHGTRGGVPAGGGEARRHSTARFIAGAEASKANLAQVDSPYVLHLATHGLYLSDEDVPGLPPVAGDGASCRSPSR